MSLVYPGDTTLSDEMKGQPTLNLWMKKTKVHTLSKKSHRQYIINKDGSVESPELSFALTNLACEATGSLCTGCGCPFLDGLCQCDDDHPVLKVGRSQPSFSRRNFSSLARGGEVGPSPTYIAEAQKKSSSGASVLPLVVLSIEGVLCAHLPTHLSGGHTDVLSRTYLKTFMDYILHQGTDWSVAFWTGSMGRKEAIEVLRMLKLPIGSAEEDEREGVVGVWGKEECSIGMEDGRKIAFKDLEVMWNQLNTEEGMHWDQHNTIVITDFPQYLRAQPSNMVLAPSFHYRMAVAAWDDQFLLMMIAVLEELKDQSNFSNYSASSKARWDEEDTWMGDKPEAVANRDSLVHDAVRACAKLRIEIDFAGGN